jgi:hypothetical protein
MLVEERAQKFILRFMSKIEEIERAAEQLSPSDFQKFATWVDRRSQELAISSARPDKNKLAVRDHSAFLNSYSPEDEGLYDDAAGR